MKLCLDGARVVLQALRLMNPGLLQACIWDRLTVVSLKATVPAELLVQQASIEDLFCPKEDLFHIDPLVPKL